MTMPHDLDNPQDSLEQPPPETAAELAATGAGQDTDADALVRQLQAELDEAVEARKRALADFKNYQRRAIENEQRAAAMATARVVRTIMPALEHFDLALASPREQMTVDNLLQAVQIVRDEFSKALALQGVERIDPKPGERFDPHRHDAVMRQQVEGAAPNTIVSTLQPGYALGDMILRPARVSVAAGEE